jgi:hypothetical protein
MAFQICDAFGGGCVTNWKEIKETVWVLVIVFYFYPSMIAQATGKKNL